MKKTFLTLALILLSYYFISIYIKNNLKIPDDAIRIRILANSNEEYDQNIKKEVQKDMQDYMYKLLYNSKNSKQAKEIISSNLNNIDEEIGNTLHSLNYIDSYKINFGLNYFPEKEYKGVKYKEGYYDSLLITLGQGKGDNWWCVLFPPLCLIEAEESTEVEYTSLVKELLDKYV